MTTSTHTHTRGNGRAQDWLKTAILLGLGLYFAALIATSSLNNYINLRFAWLAWVAAGIFFLLGGYSLFTLLRPAQDDDHDHDHSVSWGALLLLGVPLVLGTLVPSQPLGAEAVGGAISTTTTVGVTSSSTFTIAPENRNVLDWLRVFSATTDFSTLEGQPADVIGFVYTEPGTPQNEFLAARFTLSCCVADASAIGLPVVWDAAPELEAGGWVQVKGVIDVQRTGDETRPVLRAGSVEVVAQPEHPYLYP
jgi:uncharacterized repeat protein (TIGR03943 family)